MRLIIINKVDLLMQDFFAQLQVSCDAHYVRLENLGQFVLHNRMILRKNADLTDYS